MKLFGILHVHTNKNCLHEKNLTSLFYVTVWKFNYCSYKLDFTCCIVYFIT